MDRSFYESIYVPGQGDISLEAIKAQAVNRRIQEEDERLRFGFNEANRDWVIYILMPREFESQYRIDGHPVYPIMGFRDSIPSPEEAVASLQRADTRRLGNSILDRMNRENERLRASQERVYSEASEQAAEKIEHMVRKEGRTEKYGKVTMGVPTPEKRG